MRARILMSLFVFFAAPGLVRAADAPDVADVLVEVNGVPITGADLDALIVEYHQSGPMTAEAAEGLVPKLLEKAIRDELILQDALAMGMAEDPQIEGPIRSRTIKRAIALYGRETIKVEPVTDQQVEEFFDAFYHKVKIRQLSTGTPEECLDALRRIQSGEVTMGALATQISLDPKGPRGGLHNDLHWADVDTMLREAAKDLEISEFSPPFRYGGVWSVIRIESRTPPDRSELPQFERFIRGVLRSQAEESAWSAFVEARRKELSIEVDQAVLDRVREDEEILYRGDFKDGSTDVLMKIDAGHGVTEQEFRVAMSTVAMGMGGADFEEILDASIEDQERFLTMWWCADRDGWLQRPEVVEFHDRELERAVLTTYLDENIGRKVRLDRDEYERFYRDHQDDFRGADEVRMSILIANDEPTIRDAARRLSEGADFEYVRAEVEGRDAESAGLSKWSEITAFNDGVVAALESMAVGDTSDPLPYNDRWMILRLDARRPGQVPPIEEVDGAIREALYYKEFARQLDAHLARLTAASAIVRHEDRIRAWAENES